MIYEYDKKRPHVHNEAYVAPDAVITGDVTIQKNASIWFKTVIRGDVSPVMIEEGANVQDLCVLHQSPDLPLIIKEGATVGHQVTLHSCTIGKNALIGMGSLILDGAVVEDGAYVGAGSLVPPGKTIPSGKLAFGRPAKVVRDLTEADYQDMERIRLEYINKSKLYKETT